jgi:hypothetical protein
MTVTRALFRFYRPIIAWFAAVLLAAELVGVGVNVYVHRLGFSMWMVLAGSAAQYWLLVVGIMLVTMQLRQFVSNGVTRHAFIAGAALFMLILSVGFALVVVLGHGVESLLLGSAGERAPTYPVAGAADLVTELGRVLPGTLAWPVTGALIAAGYYRFRPWLGTLLLVPGALPAAVASGLLRVDEFGDAADRVSYLPALLLSLLATGLAAAAFHRAVRDVAIRRTAG